MIVVLESPYKGTPEQFSDEFDKACKRFTKNDVNYIREFAQLKVYVKCAGYAQDCMMDSIKRGESPMASHLLYTQCLDDAVPEERKLGIEAGHKFIDVCDFMVVYIDHGISEGMKQGIAKAKKLGKRIEYRRIYD